jgi:hypothetical protein
MSNKNTKKKHISKFYERPCSIIKILCGGSERLEMQKAALLLGRLLP